MRTAPAILLSICFTASLFAVDSARADRRANPRRSYAVCLDGGKISVQKKCRTELSAAKFFEAVRGSCPAPVDGRPGDTGPAGETGPRGAQGPRGARGAQGSALFAPLPAGETLTGYIAREAAAFKASADTDSLQVLTHFTSELTRALAPEDILFAGESPACAGSFEKPSAPPGKLCIYIHDAVNAAELSGLPLGTRAFGINWKVPQPGSTKIQASWAYHAE